MVVGYENISRWSLGVAVFEDLSRAYVPTGWTKILEGKSGRSNSKLFCYSLSMKYTIHYRRKRLL